VAGALLDVNVLLALAWPHHVHHRAAREWFGAHRSQGWATCPFTQAAFVRLSSQPAAVKVAVTVQDAVRTLETAVAAAEHVFWPIEHGIPEILPEIRTRLMGHRQLADGLLLDLAIR
jgi:toxin-antitoxin system PIN domain toxin